MSEKKRERSSSDESFFIAAKGVSMTGGEIWEGDLLLIDPEAPCRDNDIIITMLDRQAIVRRYRERKGSIELESINSKQVSIIFSGKVTPKNPAVFRVLSFSRSI